MLPNQPYNEKNKSHLRLESKRLKLIQCDAGIIRAINKGNKALSNLLDIIVKPGWTEFGYDVFESTLKNLLMEPGSVKWGVFLPILKSENILIGTCGFKGKPDKYNCVEIGYEIAVNYRNQGFATEITRLLVQNAFTNGAEKVIAHTLPEQNASVRVLIKNDFHFISSVHDPEDGLVWRWEKDSLTL